MRRGKTAACILAAAAMGLWTAGPAAAQANPELGDDSSVGGEVSGGASFGSSSGGSAQASGDTWGSGSSSDRDAAPAAASNPTGETDHDGVVGSFGVGFFGVRTVPIGPDGNTVGAPTIGARYWLNRDIAIQGALGIGIRSNSVRAGGSDVPGEGGSETAFALHGGVPIALATSQHFVFQVIPTVDLGFATGSATQDPDAASLSGFMFGLGGQVGAEVHFGFIGLPRLSLQGSVGLNLTLHNRKTSTDDFETSSSNFGLETFVGNHPWDIFVGAITAIYYL